VTDYQTLRILSKKRNFSGENPGHGCTLGLKGRHNQRVDLQKATVKHSSQPIQTPSLTETYHPQATFAEIRNGGFIFPLFISLFFANFNSIRNAHTWKDSRRSGGSGEVAATGGLAFLLEIAVRGVVAVVLHGVGLVTSAVLKDGRAIGPCSTGIVQGRLEGLFTDPVFAYAVRCT